jgi:hypothetical protein
MGSRAMTWMLGFALLPGLALAQGAPPITPVACSVEGMLDEVRGAMRTGSPAYRNYARKRLKEAAIAMPPEALGRAVSQERDPDVLEAVGAALATKASNAQKPELLQALLSRASQDSDPALRAAAVRAFKGSPSVEFMEKNGGVVTYEQLVRDSAPEVRQAVVENLISESTGIYFGHSPEMAEAAVKVAASSNDPAVARRLLGEVSMEAASPEAVRQLTKQLRAEEPGQRAAAAKALGGVPGTESSAARRSLTSLYKSDNDPAVRKSALEGIARLGQSGARPLLESLRGVDPRMDPEIDAWLSAFKTNLQEWHLLLREKQRLRP